MQTQKSRPCGGTAYTNTNDCNRIESALQMINPDDRDIWVKVGMAIKSEYHDSGFSLWNDWSRRSASYNERDAKDVWKSINESGGVTIGTLFYMAKENGWSNSGACHEELSQEKIEEQRRIANEQTEKYKAEIVQECADTAKKAKAILEAATEAKADHPYLERKKVLPVATLLEINASAAAEILGYNPKSKDEPLNGRLLVVPIERDHELSTLELIDESGRKTALAGRGTKAGGYWMTEPLPDGDGNGLVFVIGEGVATTLTASKAIKKPGIAALSSGNLQAVAQVMHKRYPAATLVILADLEKKTGKPDCHAIEAAQSVEGWLAVPDFGDDRKPDQTDFNDMAAAHGLEAVESAMGKEYNLEIGKHEPDEKNAPEAGYEGNSWQAPQPLTAQFEQLAYPLDSLPDAIRAAVEEVAGFVKAPVPMVVLSALSALSLAAQPHTDVKRLNELTGPSSLFLLTIADSGERKSTCDGFFTKGISDYESAQAKAAKPVLNDHRAVMGAWDAKCSGVKEKIRQLAKDQKSTEQMESALRDLEHERPEPPRIPRLLYTDATPEALAYALAKQWPSGGVVSAEAGIVFGSHGMGKESVMRNLGLLNQLWDGKSLSIDRRSTESFTVRGVRLTVALQVQEPILREFITQNGAQARGSGFLARFLIAWPDSTQGMRIIDPDDPDGPLAWPHLTAFRGKITTMLEQPLFMNEDDVLSPPILSLSQEAKPLWVNFHNAIESELCADGELCDVRDVASKSADNAARLAALFHMFDGVGDEISAKDFTGASRITAWHLNESKRFFGEVLPAEKADTARLDSWLIKYCQNNQIGQVEKSKVLQFGPLRKKEKLDAAIRELTDLDRLQVFKTGNRATTLAINPSLLDFANANPANPANPVATDHED